MARLRPLRIAFLSLSILALIAIVAIGYLQLRPNPFDTGTPLLASDARDGRIALLNENLDVDDLPQGWVHRKFWRVTPTDYAIVDHEGTPALHCATDNSGSILARDTAISLADYPILTWQWKIDRPLESTIDEETVEGDDHPARFFLIFEGAGDTRAAAEIIWSNTRFEPGDYKIIDGFHHLVANGLNENTGIWHSQSVDLEALNSKLPDGTRSPTLSLLGFFCDSDNTGGSTSAFFRNIYLEPRSN